VEVCRARSDRQEAIGFRPHFGAQMEIYQRRIKLPAFPRGCHLITSTVVNQLPELQALDAGTLHCFLLHTSASLSINENADPDVREDLEMALNTIAPEHLNYTHTVEGADDMPAHVKSTLVGCSLLIPIMKGSLVLGTWQGIYLCEHRDQGTERSIMLTAMGIRHGVV